MGEDVTEEFLIEKPQEEQPEEKEEVKTEEALKPFEQVINKGTAFIVNRFLQLTASKYQVELKESDKIKPEDIEELGFGEAVIKTIDYYIPSAPVNHPLIALATAGLMLGGLAYMKIEEIKSRKPKQEEEKKEEKEGSTTYNMQSSLEEKTYNNFSFDPDKFYGGKN